MCISHSWAPWDCARVRDSPGLSARYVFTLWGISWWGARFQPQHCIKHAVIKLGIAIFWFTMKLLCGESMLENGIFFHIFFFFYRPPQVSNSHPKTKNIWYQKHLRPKKRRMLKKADTSCEKNNLVFWEKFKQKNFTNPAFESGIWTPRVF